MRHLCKECQIGTRVLVGRNTKPVCSWCGKEWTLTAEEIAERQRQYTALANYFGATPGVNAFHIHQRIVRILDGDEPWP